jgi:peptidoglycan-associated lipoprotein
MKLKATVVALFACGILALSACKTAHKSAAGDDEASISDANNARGVNTAGLGQQDGFGDDGNGSGGRRMASDGHTYYFDFDKSEIRSEDKPSIVAHANKLAANPHKKVIVQGHTDPRGSREYNVALGERRAKAVSEMMEANGAAPRQIRVVSYGAQQLAASGHDEQDYQLDRRAVIANQN